MLYRECGSSTSTVHLRKEVRVYCLWFRVILHGVHYFEMRIAPLLEIIGLLLLLDYRPLPVPLTSTYDYIICR
jgi:hypothetical protein